MDRIENNRQNKRSGICRDIPYLIVLGIAVIFLAVFLFLRSSREICEYITDNISVKINTFASSVFGNVSFSVFEVFVILAILLVVAFIVSLIVTLVKKRFHVAIRLTCLMVSICCLFGSYYILVAGFAYNREPIGEFYSDGMEYYDFYGVVKYFKSDYDYVAEKMERDEKGLSICPYTLEELSDILKNECLRLGDNYNVDGVFSVKPMNVFSQFMSDSGITGITFMPTGDCGVNILQPSVGITFTAMHEMMHSIGIMRENEANAMSCYLLISSDNEYLRYCGYFGYYGYLLRALSLNYEESEYNAVRVSDAVRLETVEYNNYWAKQSSVFDKIGNFFNDLYLKLSGQKEGTGSYSEPTISGGVEKEEGDRVFVSIQYNSFQQAFIRTYLDKTAK